MLDHLSLGVRDLSAARRFYDALFAPLGAAVSKASPGELAYGPRGESSVIFLYPVSGDQVHGLGAHVAFTAASRLAVDAAYAAVVALGAETVRKAGLHPDISPDYYGCVVYDPDGNKLEIVAATMH